MSDEEHSDRQHLLTAEYKDGKLEIVEMPAYSKEEMHSEEASVSSSSVMQVLDSNGKNMVADLLNFTLVKGEDGEESFRLVSNSEADSSGSEATVTCVLSNGDENEQEAEEYVMVEGEDGPLVLLQSTLQQTQPSGTQTRRNESKAIILQSTPVTPAEILERAKALQKAKAVMDSQRKNIAKNKMKPVRKTRAKNPLPSTQEMLSSPNFKLFLYNCKFCSFKCNAIKELTAHKAVEHWGANGRSRGPGRAAASSLQCARCPYRAAVHSQLMKHVQENHLGSTTTQTKIQLNSAEVEAADVLVCGACGFESSSKDTFKTHIEEEHGATTC